jgi:nicotinate-nucleotide adenylyltransferase
LAKKRIGILGGTFNPPHLGHMVLAQESLRRLKLDKVIFIPAFMPPHKEVKGASARLRHKMVTLACKGNPRFEVSKIEIKRRAVSYSVDTLRKLRSRYGKGAQLFFITGSDSLEALGSWKDINEILKLARFVVAARPDFPVGKLKRGITLIRIPAIGVSSTMIRDRLRLSQPVRYLVPEVVRKFIKEKRLYK